MRSRSALWVPGKLANELGIFLRVESDPWFHWFDFRHVAVHVILYGVVIVYIVRIRQDATTVGFLWTRREFLWIFLHISDLEGRDRGCRAQEGGKCKLGISPQNELKCVSTIIGHLIGGARL
eukprot:1185183-Prorocentrum_minimum.AAC.1